MSYLGGGCTGWASTNPDFRLDYDASSLALRFYFIADSSADDTTLIIHDPHGNWVCGDDSYGTRNPTVDYYPFGLNGVYDIWIGSYNQGTFPGVFYVTEIWLYHP